MSQVAEPIVTAAYAIGLLGILGGVFSFLRFDNYKTTVRLQNDSIKALEKNNEILKGQVEQGKRDHSAAMQAVSKLEGKLESYKEIPLRDIALSLDKLATSNEAILLAVQSNQPISEGDVLVKSKGNKPPHVEVKK